MPYKSEKQRAYMYAQHPDVARKWEAEGKNYVEKSKDRTKKRQGRSQFAKLNKRTSKRNARRSAR